MRYQRVIEKSDNATLKYLGTPPNTNPVYVDLVQGGRNDYVPANTIVNLLNGLNDPRRPLFSQLSPG